MKLDAVTVSGCNASCDVVVYILADESHVRAGVWSERNLNVADAKHADALAGDFAPFTLSSLGY